MNCITLVIDGLHHGYLGCYGNSWIGTGQFDRLASQSFLFDQVSLDDPRLDRLVRALWTGRHTLDERSEIDPTLAERMAAAGVPTTLLTDEERLAEHPLTAAWNQAVQLDLPVAQQAAEEISQTALFQFFAEAAQLAATLPPPFCLWLHTRGLLHAWDAPRGLREQLRDEEDPDPPQWVDVPDCTLPPDVDPDQPLAFRQAYQAQIAVLDECLGLLMGQLEAAGLLETSVLSVLGGRGLPLGEHRRVGVDSNSLHAESIHAPWIIRLPQQDALVARSQALVQPHDFAASQSNCIQSISEAAKSCG